MTDYYVRNDGNDNNTGQDEGTGDAWKTVAKVTTGSFSAGDNIYFKKGDEWRETLTIPDSGDSDDQIAFGAYGEGVAPIIKGSDLVATWSDEGSNIWSATLNTDPVQVFFDGTLGVEDGTPDAEFDWYWDTNELFVWCDNAAGPDTEYTSPGVEATIRNYCINSDTKDYITIEDLLIQHAKHSGINMYQCDYWTIQDNECSYNYRNGIRGNTDCNNNTIYQNTCHHQTTHEGILLEGDTDTTPMGADNTISTNTCYDNNDGIQLIGDESYQSGTSEAGNIIEYNICYNHPVKHGITSEQTRNLVVRYNLCYDNAFGMGLFTEKSPQVYYNITYSNDSTEIFISKQASASAGTTDPIVYNNSMYGGDAVYGLSMAQSTDIIVKNNIAYITSSGNAYAFRIYSSTTVSSIDNNCWYAPDSAYAPDVCYDMSAGATWAEWQTATYDTNGINVDPLFIDAANGDFTLQHDSSCINIGVDVSLTQDYVGTTVPIGDYPDIGAYEYGVAFVCYNSFKARIMDGTIDLDTHTIKCALVGSGYTPSIDTDDEWADVSGQEVSGTNYTAGGKALEGKDVAADVDDDEGVFDADNTTWSSSTITARYAVLYDDSATNDDLIGYIDFLEDKVSISDDFTIQWNSEGIINLG